MRLRRNLLEGKNSLANEIWTTFEEGNTLYALIWRKADDFIWDNTGGAFVTPYTDADIGRYDVVLANQADSDYYSVDFPAAITDTTTQAYRVQIMLQVAGSINADNDLGIAQGEIQWNGADEVDLGTVFVTNQTVNNTYNEDFVQPPIQVFNT